MLGWFTAFDTTKVLTAINKSSVGSGQLSVYPNPSKGEFKIELRNVDGGMKNIQIYNELGQNVYSQSNIQNSTFTISLNQPNGVYLYRILTEKGALVCEGKIVVQR